MTPLLPAKEAAHAKSGTAAKTQWFTEFNIWTNRCWARLYFSVTVVHDTNAHHPSWQSDTNTRQRTTQLTTVGPVLFIKLDPLLQNKPMMPQSSKENFQKLTKVWTTLWGKWMFMWQMFLLKMTLNINVKWGKLVGSFLIFCFFINSSERFCDTACGEFLD